MKSFVALAALALGVTSATAATFTVTNTNDSGAGSLRDAVAQANAAPGANTIDFSVTGTIVLTSGAIQIIDALTIQGPGADQLTIDGNANGRIFATFEAAAPPCPALTGPSDYLVSISGPDAAERSRIVANRSAAQFRGQEPGARFDVTVRQRREVRRWRRPGDPAPGAVADDHEFAVPSTTSPRPRGSLGCGPRRRARSSSDNCPGTATAAIVTISRQPVQRQPRAAGAARRATAARISDPPTTRQRLRSPTRASSTTTSSCRSAGELRLRGRRPRDVGVLVDHRAHGDRAELGATGRWAGRRQRRRRRAFRAPRTRCTVPADQLDGVRQQRHRQRRRRSSSTATWRWRSAIPPSPAMSRQATPAGIWRYRRHRSRRPRATRTHRR